MAAEKGTIIHKILEILAIQKKCEQDGTSIKDIQDGDFDFSLFTHDIRSKENIDFVFGRVYRHYTTISDFAYTERDRKQLRDWLTWSLTFHNGQFNPLNKNIIAPEEFFELELEPSYLYIKPNNEVLTGHLKLRGIIDLISKVDDNTYEIVDYKTGKLKNWKTFQDKTYTDIYNDFQLQAYFLASKLKHPQVKNILCTIYYISQDKAFTIAYNVEMLKRIKDKIDKIFRTIQQCEQPKCLNTKFCTNMCWYGKTEYSPKTINEITQKPHTICSFWANFLHKHGLNEAILCNQQQKQC